MQEIESKNKLGKNGTGVRSGFIYSTLLGQKRYIHTLPAVKGARVLDCASGNGWGAFLASQAGAKEVVGVELSENGFIVAQEYYSADNIQYINSSLESANLIQGSFDVLMSFETIEHVNDPVCFLKQLRSLAHENSTLFISTPNGIAFKESTARPYNPYHLDEYSREQMQEMFEASGWKIFEYRGQHLMSSSSEIEEYKRFAKKYWTHFILCNRFGIFFRALSFLFRSFRPQLDPAYSGCCDPLIVPPGFEPAYHYFVLSPKI